MGSLGFGRRKGPCRHMGSRMMNDNSLKKDKLFKRGYGFDSCFHVWSLSSKRYFSKNPTIFEIKEDNEEELARLQWIDKDVSYEELSQRAQNYNPSSLQEWQQLSDMYWKLGKMQKCWDAQWQVLESTPRDQQIPMAQCMHTLGCIAMRMEDYSEAKRWLDASLEYKINFYNKKQKSSAQVELGKSYNAMAMWYIESTQNYEDDEFNYTNVQLALENFHTAEQHYRLSFGQEEKNDESKDNIINWSNVCQNLASLYRQNEDYEKALEYYQKAFDLKKGNLKNNDQVVLIDLYLHLGDTLYALNRHHDAAEVFETCLEKLPVEDQYQATSGILNFNLGRVHAQSGRHDLAMDHYNQALKILTDENSGDNIQEAAIYNAIGALYSTQNDQLAALRYFKKSVDIYRHNSDLEDYESEIQQIMGNIQKVERSLFGDNFDSSMNE